MKNKIFLSALIVCLCSFWGCNDFLSSTPTEQNSESVVFKDPESAQVYLDDFYRYLPIYSSFGTTEDSSVGMTEGMTDTFKYSSTVPGNHVGFANMFVFGELGYNVETVDYHLGTWRATYDRIRRINQFFNLMDEYANFDEATVELFTAQARFVRGFLYWQILKRTDPMIIYPENLKEVKKDTPLNTSKECWDYVEADLDYAASILPEKWDAANAGRITKGAAYALKSRAMLYAGRWQSAKDAAEEVFKLNYKLMDGSTWQNYQKAFTSATAEVPNTESILEFRYKNSGPSHNFNRKFSPRGDGNATIPGDGAASPTQEMVECYEYAGGGKVDWTPWHTAVGTTAPPPYELLEPRFHASILYNGADWKGRKIEPFIDKDDSDFDGKDGWSEFGPAYTPGGRTVTGYYLRKLIDETHTVFGGSYPSTQPLIIIRLAEVYLNHAEACYMLNDNAGANASVREIRKRVGLSYTDLSGEALMEAIRMERKVELAYEGHLYWDMKRWKLAHEAYSGPNSRVHGFRIVRDRVTGLDTYYYIDCDKKDRIFMPKLYRIPLPENEVKNNNSVSQFPEWL